MQLWNYPFMIRALCLCLLLTLVLSAYGHHVVRRGVIFVDLALAQMSALGASVGIHLGYGSEKPVAQFGMALLFTFLGAGLFAWFRTRKTLPIEALIGITYAGSMALSLLVLESSASGTEEIKEMLMGSILTTSSTQLVVCLVMALLSGGTLFWARKPMEQITHNPEIAQANGMKLPIWDFIFYASFGLMVTLAVHVAGVLLVFAFLIIPSLAGLLVQGSSLRNLTVGWLFGGLGCLFGLEMSLRWDTSAGPTLVVTYLVLLALFAGWIHFIHKKREPISIDTLP